MAISEWYEILLANENRIANVVNEFYASALNEFHQACRKKEDGRIHQIIYESWFRNPNKAFGPDGWEITCELVSSYPH